MFGKEVKKTLAQETNLYSGGSQEFAILTIHSTNIYCVLILQTF